MILWVPELTEEAKVENTGALLDSTEEAMAQTPSDQLDMPRLN